MTKKAVKAEVNSFVKGLITEAGPLNFPPDASLDEQNFELIRKGYRQRRLGLDYEDDYHLRVVYGFADNSAITSFIWRNAGGISGLNILVLQTGSGVSFFKLDKNEISDQGFINTLFLGVSDTITYSFSSVDGKLIVATGAPDLLALSYDGSVVSINSSFTLRVRDQWGVEYLDEDEVVNYRPPQSAPHSHFYNLYNQSWGIPRRPDFGTENFFTDPIGYFSAYYLELPSNEESVWTGMSVKASGDNPYEYMRVNAYSELRGSSPPPAKGYFIIDLLRRGASRTKAIEDNKARYPEMELSTYSTNADVTPGGPTVIHEYAGRVFYAGFEGTVINGDARSPSLANYIAFSQLVKGFSDLGKCYQEGDPTSRESNDVVDTDGGLIRLSGAGTVLSINDIGSALIVICNNGVWTVRGGSDYGFTATNYKVDQISNMGAVSATSVIRVNDSLMYWSTNGIFSISMDQTGVISSTSLTDNSIQTFYSDLSSEERVNAIGTYDDVSKTARWIVFDATDISQQSYVKEVVLDTRIPAFYVFKINNLSDTAIRGVFSTQAYVEQGIDEVIYAGIDAVLAGADSVVVSSPRRLPTKSSVRYLMLVEQPENEFYTFGYYKDTSFADWKTADGIGVDAKAYLLTGAIVGGDSSVDKQVPYVTVHMYRTETGVDADLTPINQSSCLMRAQWEWSNSATSNKWGRSQQVYRLTRPYFVGDSSGTYDPGFELVSTKNKLRGQGKAVSLYFETEPTKDCRIVGWNINVNGNSTT